MIEWILSEGYSDDAEVWLEIISLTLPVAIACVCVQSGLVKRTVILIEEGYIMIELFLHFILAKNLHAGYRFFESH